MAVENLLCVGGPRDGQVVTTQHGEQHLISYKQPLMPISYAMDGGVSSDVVNVERVVYRRERFFYPRVGADLHIWVPEKQDIGETVWLLLSNYRPLTPPEDKV